MDCTNAYDHFQQCRAAGSFAGWAELLFGGALTKEERQKICLTSDEGREYRRFKAGRKGIRKLLVAHEELAQLRRAQGSYWLTVRVRTGRAGERDLVDGTSLPPGVPRFVLTEEEADAVRLQDARATAESDYGKAPFERYEWRRVQAGVYVSTNWKWWVERDGSRQWYAYRDGDLWGRFERDFSGWREYKPFETLSDAQNAIESRGD